MAASAEPLRVAIAQIPMHWTTAANTVAIESALQVAAARDAGLCLFGELAITGFHREIRREAVPAIIEPAVARIRAACRSLKLACAVGAPTFAAGGAIVYNSYLLIDEQGALAAQVDKTGQTAAEATFFHGGRGRPVALLQGRRTSAVLCREIEDLALVRAHLPSGAAELICWPGVMGRAPENRESTWVDVVPCAQQLARQQQSYVLQVNSPNALNNPPDSPDSKHLGASKVFATDGELLLTLPACAAGVATFELGARRFVWDAAPA